MVARFARNHRDALAAQRGSHAAPTRRCVGGLHLRRGDPTHDDRSVPPLGSLATFVGALAACGYSAFQLFRALLASRWPEVEGEIGGTRLVHRLDADGPSADYDYVAYRYRVGGRAYRNDRVRFGPQIAPTSIVPEADPPPDNPWAAADLARRYPTGQRVRVRYNPRRPQDSVLHVGPSASVWIILATGLLFLYLGTRDLFWHP